MSAKDLALYRAKRDFTATEEPSGRIEIKPAKYPRFVVQKHAASRLHFDLRLELDGVFKSWAVTKGPSMDPKDKRLAVEVEDHPLEYGDFEGTIPQGEYGGGTVMLWDRGFWMPEETGDPLKALRAGELKFTLAGEKLQGSWVLVRLRPRDGEGKRNNWLLIKHKHDLDKTAAAKARISDADRSVASGRSMREIAAGKGRRPRPFMQSGDAPSRSAVSRLPDVWSSASPPVATVAKSTKAPRSTRTARSKKAPGRKTSAARRRATRRKTEDPSEIPRFVAPQLCKSQDRPPDGPGWVHEVKLDGYRMQMRVQDGRCTLRTRKGLDWSDKFTAIARAGEALPDCLIDGEIVALDHNGASNFPALQVAISESRSQDLIFFAFDLLNEAGEDLTRRPLLERKQRLQALLEGATGRAHPVKYVEHLADPGESVLQAACRLNLEGIVSKRVDAGYDSGRTASWVKSKCRGGQEVVIGGWSGTSRTVRSLLVGVWHDEALTYVDLGLVAIFGLQHSLMARPWFKHWTARMPTPWQRVTYVHAANAALLLLVIAWQPIPDLVWSVTWKPAETLVWAGFVLGWLLLSGALSFGIRDLLGIDALLRWGEGLPPAREQLKTGYLYRWISHPMYVGVLLAFWSTPRMSVGQLLLAGGMTVYVLIAVRFEERDLGQRFGAAYGVWRADKPTSPRSFP